MAKIVKFKEINKDFDQSMNELYEVCENDINEINNLIIEKLESNVALVKEITKYLILSGGKRLRPLLTVACARMSGYGNRKEERRHINLAAAIEFIHTATLMHDDVVDKSESRRGKPSSNTIWGNKTSVLVGDFLFSRAFQLMAKDKSNHIMKILSDTSVIISEGEILELSVDRNPTISENVYFEVINGKTASLFSAACEVAGIIANLDTNKIQALKTFGTNFGMAFQLIDDSLDYSSTFNKIGKQIGDDFKEGKITLPVILCYLRGNESEKKFWDRTINKLNQKTNDFSDAISLIEKYNCIEDTIIRAKHFSNIAKDSLGAFENNDYKIALLNIVDQSFNRTS